MGTFSQGGPDNHRTFKESNMFRRVADVPQSVGKKRTRDNGIEQKRRGGV